MRKQRAPTVVLPVAVLPRLIVQYSRMIVPLPISTHVSSPLYLSPAGHSDDGAVPDLHASATRYALDHGMRGDAAMFPPRHARPDDAVRADRHIGAELGGRIDQCGSMNHLSTTIAIISASATTWPST